MQFIKSFLSFLNEKEDKENFEDKIKGDGYFKGLSLSTARKKAAQIKAQSKLDDDDPAAYEPLPGDTKGKKLLKTSTHTKKYHELFGDKDKANESTVNENTSMNKDVKSLLDKSLSEKAGSPPHLFAMKHILIGALTDANFHPEAKKVPALFPKAEFEPRAYGENAEEAIKMYEYEIGPQIARICQYDGGDIVDAIGFYVSKTIGKSVGEKIQKLVESVNEETVYIDFLNKDKNFKQDRKYFKGKNAYDSAVKWAKNNFEKFNPDMIHYESMNETNEDLLELVNEETYKVAGRPVTLNKGKKSNGTDWTVTFQNGEVALLADVAALIKPFPKGITKESMNEMSEDLLAEEYEALIVEKFSTITATGLTKKHKDDLIKMGANIKVSGPGYYIMIKTEDMKQALDYLDKEGIDVNESLNEKASGDRSPIGDDALEKGLEKKSDETGVPMPLLRIVMRRGMAAWKSGRRPGAGQEQWGYARVNSFLTKGPGTWGRPLKDPVKGGPKGAFGADADVAKEVIDGGHDKKL